ncbi:pantetheine-phosphate adenylyltransferase [Apilactobacillus apisilvae]|uniref:Phosphopantetheine adenylyltransferase n=1 Tax=Apilactobacillus apisilvae TaxID=2923364 RepID=A0ABY4PIX1_9LACO|nr:pantetheine-phosphate adenylyltransferase [Apilactobacillus apisilvae]UQS85517.1 pantetheine-phosphate adenylyltransferase [Apilactobacillus apisilvae]
MTIAIFPGSFDPITNGHLDLIKRASKQFDKLIVTVAKNTNKNGMFSLEERMQMVKLNVSNLDNVDVKIADGLIVDFAKSMCASVIVRGLRNINDFSAENSIFNMNYNLDNSIDTMLLIAKPKYQVISSSLIKEVFHFGGDVSQYVPENVLNKLKGKIF